MYNYDSIKIQHYDVSYVNIYCIYYSGLSPSRGYSLTSIMINRRQESELSEDDDASEPGNVNDHADGVTSENFDYYANHVTTQNTLISWRAITSGIRQVFTFSWIFQSPDVDTDTSETDAFPAEQFT